MTIQVKTTLLFTLLTAGFIFAVSVVVYFFSGKFAFRDFYKRLEIRAYIVAKSAFEQDKNATSVYRELRDQSLERLSQEREYILRADEGKVPHAAIDSAHMPVTFLQNIISDGKATYFSKGIYYSGILYQNNGKSYAVIVSARNDYGDEVQNNLRQILLICWLASTLIVFTAGLAFSRTIFRPIRNITGRVNDISAENLHLRLPDRKGKDEIAVLTDTFNDLLARLETAFDIQKNFVSNASHELRTPLTAIIGEADLALYKERQAEDYRQSLEIILQEAEKLQNLTNSLLSLAQTGTAGAALQTGPIRLDDLLRDIKQTIEKMHPEYPFTLALPQTSSTADAPYVKGNYALLRLAISNVVMNAFKYSKAAVIVQLEQEQKHCIISIIDEGIGIPEDELKYIFVPFFRASNTGNYEGHGIGLPLTSNIIRFHGGKIVAQSAVNKGTRIKIILPAVRLYA
ncbi:HAMP domain-containing sensor histidine kinase [Chitinophagaceae bacterium MMS25-I14]